MKGKDIIPEHVQAFASDFAALASKHGLREATVSLRAGYDRGKQEWDNPINISWSEGRHGEKQRDFFISTTIDIRASLTWADFDALKAGLPDSALRSDSVGAEELPDA